MSGISAFPNRGDCHIVLPDFEGCGDVTVLGHDDGTGLVGGLTNPGSIPSNEFEVRIRYCGNAYVAVVFVQSILIIRIHRD